MCGIAGIMQLDGRPLDGRLLETMTTSLAHRGPDGEGYVLLAPGRREKPVAVNGRLSGAVGSSQPVGPFTLGFGHRRLAVIDLTPLAHQPMGTEDGRFWITYNGEVYNAPELRRELVAMGIQFRSASDTEVVLESYRHWGPACLDRFNGMFAFAIWDGRAQQLFCARDRFGIKPFYYRETAGRFLFASEIKALLQDSSCRVCPNDALLYDYLTLAKQDHTTGTFFEGIQQLAPGERMTVRSGRRAGSADLVRERWWRFPVGSHDRALTLNQAAARTRELIEDCVRLELRSDVPVGSCLSGGLDSSTIVCVMSRLLAGTSQPRTFSSCHEDVRFDERPFIRSVVEETGAANHQVFPDIARLARALPDILWHQEEPVGGTSILAQWAVMEAAGGAGMKVLLDGQGADELLLGYPRFMGARLADLVKGGRWFAGLREWGAWRSLHGGLPLTGWAGLVRGLLPAGQALRLRAGATGQDGWLDRRFVSRVGGPDRAWAEEDRGGRTALDREVARSVTQDLPALLHYEDRNSMAFSIEARVPFLDHRLVEWLAGLPPDCKVRDGVTKVVLREAMAGVLPETVRLRRDKMGFVTPEDRWLRVELRPQIEALLESESFRARPYWRAPVVRDWYRRYCGGRTAIGPLVWRWINLEWWLRRFCD
ncbi:MAG: asparagine synthase (glutamine-hydrolyzing) [Nitrospirota bacterium]